FVAAALRTPWTPEPHRALGQALLARQRAREAALELAVAAGISRGAVDLAWLGQAYEAMGAVDEALAAYRRALTVGLPRDIYAVTRNRFFALERQAGGDLDPLRTHP
ncbi:MAG: tetratricopeptide repeat protein, partial [Candidatus Eisenbacteria bacterium]|nr:tetratricopeptide repeat protein [Candidatus Eisenbacteria bacterium]